MLGEGRLDTRERRKSSLIADVCSASFSRWNLFSDFLCRGLAASINTQRILSIRKKKSVNLTASIIVLYSLADLDRGRVASERETYS